MKTIDIVSHINLPMDGRVERQQIEMKPSLYVVTTESVSFIAQTCVSSCRLNTWSLEIIALALFEKANARYDTSIL